MKDRAKLVVAMIEGEIISEHEYDAYVHGTTYEIEITVNMSAALMDSGFDISRDNISALAGIMLRNLKLLPIDAVKRLNNQLVFNY